MVQRTRINSKLGSSLQLLLNEVQDTTYGTWPESSDEFQPQ